MNAFWSTLTGRSNTPEPSSPMSATSRPTRRKSSASPKQPKPDFSFGGLQTLLDELISITGDADTPSSIVGTSPDHLVELIRAIAETLLWAEQNQDDSSMFDHFCERGIIKVFVNLLNAPTIMSAPTSGLSIFTSPSASTMISSNRQIKVQLLQTMSLLVLNIKRDTSLYFLFSNNAINQLINNNNNLDFSDEEILSYYVTFMKSIALRISADSVKLFMNERSSNYFPLFIQSIRFFDHHDRMIRTAVRTITLCIFKLYPANENLGKFLRENTGGYFSLLASQLRDLWLLIDRTLEDLKVVPIASIESGLSVIIDELIDQLEYIADINRLDIPEDLKILLQDQLKAYAIDPVLIPSLISSDKPEETGGDNKLSSSPKLALKTAYFVTTFLVNIFPNSSTMMETLVYQKIFNSAQFKSQIIVVLKTCEMPTLMPLIIFLTSLARNVTSESTPGWREFGLVPPESIELSILITQSLSRAIDKLNLVSVQLILNFLKNHIFALSSTYPEFIKPIHLTLSDAFRSVASRVVAIMNNSVLITPTKLSSSPTVSSNAPDFDYSLIDDFEKILLEFVVPNTSVLDEQVLYSPRLLMNSSRSGSDVFKKDLIGDEWTVSDPSVLLDNAGGGGGKMIFRKFFCLAVNEKKIETSTLEKVFFEIFVTNDSSEDVTEGSILDLSEKDRILCTHISSNRSTRYLIIDPSRLMLVTPDITKPGFAVVKFAILLRSIKSMSVDKQDERILRLTISSSSSSSSPYIELGFEDAKRSYLALTHLETRRVEIRKDIFTKIRKYISDFSR